MALSGGHRRHARMAGLPLWTAAPVPVAAIAAYLAVNRAAGHDPVVRAVAFQAVTTGLVVAGARILRRHESRWYLDRITLYRACLAFWLGDAARDVVGLGVLPDSWGLDSPWVAVLLMLPAYVLLGVHGVGQALTGGVWRGTDALVAGLAGASGAYVTLLQPLLSAGSGAVTETAFAALDTVTVGILVAGLLSARREWASWLAFGAMAAAVTGDELYRLQAAGAPGPGGAVDVCWLLRDALMIAVLLTPVPPPDAGPQERSSLPRSRVLALGLCTLFPPCWLGYLAFARGGGADGMGVLAVATAVVTALVTARLTALNLRYERLATRLSGSLREREQMQETLERQVMVDTLTGLANRFHFRKATEETAGRQVGCVMFIDLDDFKLVNDTRGHQAGDDLLVELAGRLRQLVRGDDLVARLGGDEFAVLLPGTDVDDARLRAIRVIDSLTRDVHLPDGGSPVRVGASIGVAELTDDPDQSLAAADMAMYAAKRAGKGTVAVFDEGMRDALQGEARFASDLEAALAGGNLECAFQPVVDLTDPRYIAFEALVRWRRDGLAVPPDVFLPVAAQRGLAPAVDMLMLHKALDAVQNWRLQGFEVSVHVNVSAQLALRPDFTDLVLAALARYHVPGPRLVLEMTEQVVIDDTAAVAGKLRLLQLQGVRVALDDFGTGYSSLAYLQELPVDILKLDKALVRRGTAHREASDLLKSIIDMGHSLRMRVTAEGIETPQQQRVISALGCDFGQGWLWGTAMDPHETRLYLVRTHTTHLMERFHAPYRTDDAPGEPEPEPGSVPEPGAVPGAGPQGQAPAPAPGPIPAPRGPGRPGGVEAPGATGPYLPGAPAGTAGAPGAPGTSSSPYPTRRSLRGR